MDCQILLGMFLFHLKIFLFEKKNVIHYMGALPPPDNNSRRGGEVYFHVRIDHFLQHADTTSLDDYQKTIFLYTRNMLQYSHMY